MPHDARTLGSREVNETHETTTGKLERLQELRREALHAGQREGRCEASRRGSSPRARARREALRPRFVRRARPLRPPPRGRVRDAREAPVRRRGRDRLRHRLRAEGLPLLAGLHRFRRLAERGLRGEDLQGHGHGPEVRLPRDRDQRLRRRAHPGGRRLARRIRRDLLAQRPILGRRAAALAHHGSMRRRRRLLARDDRLHLHGRGFVVHVHHRPRCREDGDGGGGHVRGARRRDDTRGEVRRGAVHGARTRRRASRTRATS